MGRSRFAGRLTSKETHLSVPELEILSLIVEIIRLQVGEDGASGQEVKRKTSCIYFAVLTLREKLLILYQIKLRQHYQKQCKDS